MWSGNGCEIYYRGDGALVAVAFAISGSEPAIERPTVLFKDEYDLSQASLSNFDVTPDGRFLLLELPPMSDAARSRRWIGASCLGANARRPGMRGQGG